MGRKAIACLELQASESVVVSAASQLLAAYIRTGELEPENERALVAKCARLAIALALETDRIVQSDEEEW